MDERTRERARWGRRGGPRRPPRLAPLTMSVLVTVVTAVAISDAASARKRSPAASADDASFCGSRSPTLERLGATYFELDAPAPEADARRARRRARDGAARAAEGPTLDPHLAGLLDRLDAGELRGGSGTRTRCLADGPPDRAFAWTFELEQLERVATLDGLVRLTAFEARRTLPNGAAVDARLIDETLAAATIDLPDRSAWHVAETGDGLGSSRRFRRLGADSPFCASPRAPESFDGTPRLDAVFVERCRPLAEIVLRARAVGRTIELERLLYVGGLASERLLWRLGT